jgi:hypothetical protein
MDKNHIPNLGIRLDLNGKLEEKLLLDGLQYEET